MTMGKLMAILATIVAFFAGGSLVALIADKFLGPLTQILVLFAGFTGASFVYYQFVNEKPENETETRNRA